MRSLLLIGLFLTLYLYISRVLQLESSYGSALTAWIFLFAFLMSVLNFIPMLILLAWDLILFAKQRKMIHLTYFFVDLIIPIISRYIFTQYYELLGHP
jgi:Na+/phosphate symporter